MTEINQEQDLQETRESLQSTDHQAIQKKQWRKCDHIELAAVTSPRELT